MEYFFGKLKLTDSQYNTFLPMRNLLAFTWVPIKKKGVLLMPEDLYELKPEVGQDIGIRTGYTMIGKIFRIGPEVLDLKINDYILIHEYSLSNYSGEWKENQVYFVYEDRVEIQLGDFNEKNIPNIERKILSQDEVQEILDSEPGQEVGGTTEGSMKDARGGRERAAEKLM